MAQFIKSFADLPAPQPRKTIIVEQSTQTSIQDAVESGFGPLSFNPGNLDLIRFRLHKYWNNEGVFAQDLGYNDTAVYDPPWEIPNFDADGGITDPIECDAGICSNTSLDTTKVIMTVKINEARSYFGATADWDAKWVWNIDNLQSVAMGRAPAPQDGLGKPWVSIFGDSNSGMTRMFYDHACEIEIPFTKKAMEQRSFGGVKMPYADIKPEYNFFVDGYEGGIKKQADDGFPVDERVLPNMYAFLLVQQSEDNLIVYAAGRNNAGGAGYAAGSIDTPFEKNVTLDGKIQDVMVGYQAQAGVPYTQQILNSRGELDTSIPGGLLEAKMSKGQYFDKWANGYTRFREEPSNVALTDQSQPTPLAKKYTNLIIPMSDLQFYRDSNNKKNRFPMGVDINFSTDSNTQFAQALQQSRLSSVFIKSIIDGSVDYASSNLNPLASVTRTALPPGTNQTDWEVESDAEHLLIWAGPGSQDFFVDGGWGTVPLSAVTINRNRMSRDVPLLDPNFIAPPFYLGDEITITDFANTTGDTGQAAFEALVNDSATTSIMILGWTKTATTPARNAIWRGLGLSSAARITTVTGRAGRRNRWQTFSMERRNTARHHVSVDIGESMRSAVIKMPQNEIAYDTYDQWDITTWLEILATDPTETFEADGTTSDNTLFLGAYNEEIEVAAGSDSADFYKTLMTIIFSGKFSKLLKEKTRTFRQILEGKKAYSETVFYKIEKWGPQSTTEPIQSFYLPNSNDVDVHRYVDTQVKYGVGYTYKIFAYQAVFGNQYQYSLDAIGGISGNNDPNAPDAQHARICVFTAPSVRLIKIPYYTSPAKIIDKPPIWPDVDIIQYKNFNDKVLFFLRGNVGDYKLNPVIIENSDEEEVVSLRESQNIADGLPIEYKSDDQARTFQIFRTENRPTRYSDFNNHKIKEVETIFEDPKKAATAAAWVDQIKPNKKYYYTFRTIDNHDHISNPTPIYQVEIVDNDAAPVLLSEVIELKRGKEPAQISSKCGQRYIYIRLAPEQLELNEDESNLLDSNGSPIEPLPDLVKNEGVKLGTTSETVWDNNYKIRLTSKKTGKKIDFRIKFLQSHIRSTSGQVQGG